MIPLIICVIVSAIPTLFLMRYLEKQLEALGFRIIDEGLMEKDNASLFSERTLVSVAAVPREMNASMSREEREAEVQLLRDFWNTDRK